MDSSAFTVQRKKVSPCALTPPPPSKFKRYGFAIAIIMGVGGTAAGAAGLAGYFHLGALSNMAQVDAIIMMAGGGGGGIIMLIVGVVGTLKNRQRSSHQRQGAHVNSEGSSAASESRSTESLEIIGSIDTKGGLVYGREAWKIWGVEVLDNLLKTPRVYPGKKDKVLLYIPQKIRVNGKTQDFTLKALKEISGGPFLYFSNDVEEQFGEAAAPGWVLIDKDVIPESRNKDYESQKKMVEKNGCSMPSVLEAVALCLMVYAYTGERLYGENSSSLDGQGSSTYTRCIEKVNGESPIIVGDFGSAGLNVLSYDGDWVSCGVACVRRVSRNSS
ncbi:MAG: hypothetical protein JJU12_06410 [Chlamydiales bacterium]|nr:hypothetical protein [Chlamydiales bacterium]